MAESEPDRQNNEDQTDALRVDVSQYHNVHSLTNRFMRLLWGIVWMLLFRPSPKPCNAWRLLLLRLFGARLGKGVRVHSSVKIWAPWNLRMDDHSCLAPYVDCYCAGHISIGAHSTVSQYSFLCTASHDYERSRMPLTIDPIIVEDQVWLCADVFVGPGVTVGQGTVIGARSSVFSDIPPWQIAVGTPAKPLKERRIRDVRT